MPLRLMAVDEGPNIPIDRDIVVVGRHPQCNARLDSIRISRRHCCMIQDHGEVIVQDLGSTNGIRINGQRVEKGRLRAGDELSIAHIRFRVESTADGEDRTLADSSGKIPKPALVGAAPVHPNGHSSNGHSSNAEVHESKESRGSRESRPSKDANGHAATPDPMALDEAQLAEKLREALPAEIANQYKIQVILKKEPDIGPEAADPCLSDSSQ